METEINKFMSVLKEQEARIRDWIQNNDMQMESAVIGDDILEIELENINKNLNLLLTRKNEILDLKKKDNLKISECWSKDTKLHNQITAIQTILDFHKELSKRRDH